jgi:hypothetical protein
MMRLLSLGLAIALVLGGGTGCTKRVPAELEEGRFAPTQKVVVTFTDGSQIKGKIAQDETVEILHDGSVYRGSIMDLSYEDIQVVDCRLIRSAGSREAEVARMTQARNRLGDQLEEFVFRMEEIERVEEIQIDPLRTTTQSIFWTLTGVVSVFLLADRS